MATSQIFSGLRFTRHDLPPGSSLSIAIARSMDQCGVYILEFTDGRQYVGLTTDITGRYAAHSRRWADIASIAFANCPQELLDAQESAVIAEMERRGFILRNVNKTGRTIGDRPLDMVFEKSKQIQWVSGGKVGRPDVARLKIAQQRARKRTRLKSLLQHPAAEAALDDAATFIQRVLPDPGETEAMFWTISAFSSTAAGFGQRLLTINTQNVEALYCVEGKKEDESGAFTVLNVSMEGREAERWLNKQPYVSWAGVTEIYTTTGPCWSVVLNEPGHLSKLLGSRSPLLKPARSFALNLMLKGPSMHQKSHDFAFADLIFERMAKLK